MIGPDQDFIMKLKSDKTLTIDLKILFNDTTFNKMQFLGKGQAIQGKGENMWSEQGFFT